MAALSSGGVVVGVGFVVLLLRPNARRPEATLRPQRSVVPISPRERTTDGLFRRRRSTMYPIVRILGGTP